MHLQVRIALELADLNQRSSRGHGEPLFGASIGASTPARGDQVCQLGAARAPTEGLTEARASRGVEAEIPYAVGCEPASIARATERAGCRRDDTEAEAVRKTATLRRGRARLDDGLDPTVPSLEDAEHLGAGDDLAHRPRRRATHVHVLDETHL